MKFVPVVLIWVLSLGVVVPSMFFYHPVNEVFISSVGMMLVLMLLISWVGLRLQPKKFSGFLGLALVSGVSGFMANQGFDAIYVVFLAPLGGRWDTVIEIAVVGGFLFLFALVNLLFWPKRKVYAQTDNGEDSQNP